MGRSPSPSDFNPGSAPIFQTGPAEQSSLPGDSSNDETRSGSSEAVGEAPEPSVEALLAEDNRVDVMMIAEAIKLHALPIHLNIATDGEQACEFIDRVDANETSPCPRLVILDLNLPRKTGIEIIERLRSSPKCKNAAVLVITSSDLSRERQELAKFGVSRFFRKPTGYDEFLAIGEVLDQLLRDLKLP